MEISYIPSRVLPGETELIRERSFTRWMSRDLTQAAADFCKNIGLSSIYSEVSAEGAARYLFWQPRGMPHEVRTGRTLEQFKAFDQVNIGRGWALLSLHVNEEGIYSAVWVPPDGFDTGKKVLEVYGITPGERRTGGTS